MAIVQFIFYPQFQHWQGIKLGIQHIFVEGKKESQEEGERKEEEEGKEWISAYLQQVIVSNFVGAGGSAL